MNTVMKLYLQAWVFWGVASAYFVSRTKNRALVVGAAVLIAVMAVHPACTLLAMPGAEFMGGTEEMTLDGSAWLREQKPDEYNALSWLRETAGDGDVVLEAPGDAYTYSSRVGPFTGLPTIIGWRTHEIMWGGIGRMSICGPRTQTACTSGRVIPMPFWQNTMYDTSF